MLGFLMAEGIGGETGLVPVRGGLLASCAFTLLSDSLLKVF